MRQFQIVGCVDASGYIRRKFTLVSVEESGLSPLVAGGCGFKLVAGQWERELTPEIVAREVRKDRPTATVVYAARLGIIDGVVEQSPDFPVDTAYRGAWVLSGKKVVVDMPKARQIHADRVRALRAPILAALDIEYQIADELGDAQAKQDIAVRKQALRDAPADPAITAAKTPDELAAAIPAALKKEA